MSNLINKASLKAIETAASRTAAIAGELFEFALRRAEGSDVDFSGPRYACIVGFEATSNLSAGQEFDIPRQDSVSSFYYIAYSGTPKLMRANCRDQKSLLNKVTKPWRNFTYTVEGP